MLLTWVPYKFIELHHFTQKGRNITAGCIKVLRNSLVLKIWWSSDLLLFIIKYLGGNFIFFQWYSYMLTFLLNQGYWFCVLSHNHWYLVRINLSTFRILSHQVSYLWFHKEILNLEYTRWKFWGLLLTNLIEEEQNE